MRREHILGMKPYGSSTICHLHSNVVSTFVWNLAFSLRLACFFLSLETLEPNRYDATSFYCVHHHSSFILSIIQHKHATCKGKKSIPYLSHPQTFADSTLQFLAIANDEPRPKFYSLDLLFIEFLLQHYLVTFFLF